VTKEYGRIWGLVLLVSVLAVNLVTIGADLEGGAAALSVIFPVDYRWFTIPFAVGTLAMLILGTYDEIQRVLRYVLLVFLAYSVSAFLAHPNWGSVLHQTVVPSISLSATYIQGALALLGTTLTSYAYVWETIEVAEERPDVEEVRLKQADAGFGMVFAVANFWFILISAGATLGVHHKQVQTAQQAAQALQPVAGPAASYLFAIGLLASAVLAVPVLAATSGYILGSEFGWVTGLSRDIRRAWRFNATVAGTMVVGVVVSFLGVSPIQLLFVAGIVGGIGTPISLAFLLLIARNHDVMGDLPVGKILIIASWVTAAVVTGASLIFLWQQIHG
jgi:Mn2+/Fe2+ NRAMP family transporter